VVQVCPHDKQAPIRDLLEKRGGLAANKLPPPTRPTPVAATSPRE